MLAPGRLPQVGEHGGVVLRAFPGPGGRRVKAGTVISPAQARSIPVQNRIALAESLVDWYRSPQHPVGGPTPAEKEAEAERLETERLEAERLTAQNEETVRAAADVAGKAADAVAAAVQARQPAEPPPAPLPPAPPTSPPPGESPGVRAAKSGSKPVVKTTKPSA